jgi:hypothetical protein
VVTEGLSNGPSGRAPLQSYSGSSFLYHMLSGLSADQFMSGDDSDLNVEGLVPDQS